MGLNSGTKDAQFVVMEVVNEMEMIGSFKWPFKTLSDCQKRVSLFSLWISVRKLESYILVTN